MSSACLYDLLQLIVHECLVHPSDLCTRNRAVLSMHQQSVDTCFRSCTKSNVLKTRDKSTAVAHVTIIGRERFSWSK